MTCRNQLMNEGKPYGKSSCEECGSILFGRFCVLNILPNPPLGSGLGPEHYVSVVSAEPQVINKYAALIRDSYSTPGWNRNDPSETVYYNKFVEFESEEALKNFILENNNKTYGGETIIKVLRCQELKIRTEVTVSLI